MRATNRADVPQPDEWVAEAAAAEVRHLNATRLPRGWPARADESKTDSETTLWARLALAAAGIEGGPEASIPPDNASEPYRRVRAALDAARSGASPESLQSRNPFDRLVHAIARGHLEVTG